MNVFERFFNKVEITESCWTWTGATAAGYGRFAAKSGRMNALNPRGISVPDWSAPFRYGHPDGATMMRTFEPYIACGFTDDEAWHALFTDQQRLDVFKSVHGNRKSPVKKKPVGMPVQFVLHLVTA